MNYLWGLCCTCVGLGLCQQPAYAGCLLYERTALSISCIWWAVLLIIHAGRQSWAFCKLDGRLDRHAWLGVLHNVT